jgi:hypothetical protein
MSRLTAAQMRGELKVELVISRRVAFGLVVTRKCEDAQQAHLRAANPVITSLTKSCSAVPISSGESSWMK